MVNFGEDRRTELAISTLLTSTPGPTGSFKVCSDGEENGVRKAMGSYRTYLSLVKLQPWFLSLQWKICLSAELQSWLLRLQWKTWPQAEHSDDDPETGCVSFVFSLVLSLAVTLIFCWPQNQEGPPLCSCLEFWSIVWLPLEASGSRAFGL